MLNFFLLKTGCLEALNTKSGSFLIKLLLRVSRIINNIHE